MPGGVQGKALVARALTRAVPRMKKGLLRDEVYRRLRRLDPKDDYSREVMRAMLDVEVGRGTYGAFRIDGTIAPGTRIGAFCSVAPDALIGGANHPLDKVSTHPILYLRSRGMVEQDDAELQASLTRPITIEDDVWLGARCVVLPGLTIGRGAVIGAGAVVTRDVEPYSIMVGVPAKELRKRFSDEDVAALCQIPWPSWSDETIRERIADFQDVRTFLNKHGPRAG